MNEPKRKEDAATAWTWVGCWVLLIYLTIPLARTLQEFIRDAGGKSLFLWATYLAFALGAIAVIRAVTAQQIKLSIGRSVLLAAILGLFSYLTWALRRNPEEALHFVQYGVLSLLVYRALRHHLSDVSIFAASAMIASFFGILDECIQWIVPRRYFDFRDIGINVLAVVLVQLALGLGIRPASITSPARARGKRIAYGGLALNLSAILMCLSMTPTMLGLIRGDDNDAEWLKQPMTQYGYLYIDEEIGRFKSRLSPEELKRQDRERYEDVLPALHKSMHDHRYIRLINKTRAYEKPLLIEARVHLFRRDRYASKINNPKYAHERARNATIAWYENRIMEKYFPYVLSNSKYLWNPVTRRMVDEASVKHGQYESAVSSQLITIASQRTFTIVLGVMILGALAGLLRVRPDREPEA